MITALLIITLMLAKKLLAIIALVKLFVDGDVAAAIVCLAVAVLLGGADD